jgi:hypothetical protein
MSQFQSPNDKRLEDLEMLGIEERIEASNAAAWRDRGEELRLMVIESEGLVGDPHTRAIVEFDSLIVVFEKMLGQEDIGDFAGERVLSRDLRTEAGWIDSGWYAKSESVRMLLDCL